MRFFVGVFILVDFLLLATSSAIAETSEDNTLIDSGASLRVEFFARPHPAEGGEGDALEAGKTAEVGFRISDSSSGYPVSDLHPAAWISRRPSLRQKPSQENCERGIKKYSGGGLIKETNGDLNNYFIISLNADQTVGIFNPQVNLATSNLMALIPLKGKPADWVFDESLGLLYVTLPEKNAVTVVDINRREVIQTLEVGARPTKIRQQPDGRYLWVASEGLVSIIDPARSELVKTLKPGQGALDFAFDPKGRITYISSAGDGKITPVAQAGLEMGESIALDPGPMHPVFSPLSSALYVGNSDSGTVSVLFSGKAKRMKTLKLAPGISRMKTSPDGRFIFVLHQRESSLTLLDTSTSGVSRKLSTLKRPDDVIFSKNFAYIHHAGSNHVSIVQLSALSLNDPPPVADIPMGAKTPDAVPGLEGVSLIDIIPDESGALIANPADQSIYLYRESGMLAPSNSFKTYTAAPLGLFIYDHSLVERRAVGEYFSTATLERGGTYDVYFLLSNPLVATCFEMEVKGTPWEENFKAENFVMESLTRDEDIELGKATRLRFRLTRGAGSKPVDSLSDLRVLGVHFFGGWQVRKWAKPVGDGVYEVEMTFPHAGKYHLMVQSHSLGVRFGNLRHTFKVGDVKSHAVKKQGAP
jgi:DNA-binding beta-propeller fold protein YncE